MAPIEQWPFQEARRILDHVGGVDQPILLETGYGPSGLPHIGTFGEVVRTSFIMLALADLGAKNVSCCVFSDDMDGLRKVPLNMPDWLGNHLGKPLNDIPDPFGGPGTYAGTMNGRLMLMVERMTRDFRRALRRPDDVDPDSAAEILNLELAQPQPRLQNVPLGPYTFRSSTQQYRSGVFNESLSKMLRQVEDIRAIILPTLGEEKRDEWSPFFPVCSKCGCLYTTRVTGYHPERDTLDYACDRPMGSVKGCGHSEESSVRDGRVKVGWKVDWALRWYTFGVSYEMYGKDLIESATLSSKIVRALGGKPPVNYFYEMFLDEQGAKISKSVGKGVTVDTWMNYAPFESLALFMYRNPKRAKRLFLGVIPEFTDSLLEEIRSHYAPPAAPADAKAPAPDGSRSVYQFLRPCPPPGAPFPAALTYGMLTNMVGTIAPKDRAVVRQYLDRAFGPPQGETGQLDSLIDGAMAFCREVLAPAREPFVPSAEEKTLIAKLAEYLKESHSSEEIQTQVFSIAKESGMDPKQYFRALYGVLSGQERGPRLGPFIKILGESTVRAVLEKVG